MTDITKPLPESSPDESQSFLKSLNPKQLEAVTHTKGSLLILAGAGTGKTTVLTSRIAYLIQQGIVKPYNILAVTFTNKAAREMQDRISNLINADGLNIGTFHSIAARMLRSHIQLLDIGISQNFTIVDQDDQIRLIKAIALENNIDVKEYKPKLLHTIISRWKDQSLLPTNLSPGDVKYANQKMAKIVYHQYQQQLSSSNAVDFGDLLLYCNLLLVNHPDILQYYQDKFQYILIDEYQDTNIVQYLWARMLASKNKNICCVGDDDQSIYSWRGAEVKNILKFEQDFKGAAIIKLEQNYRSSSYILEAASNIIQHNENRHPKKLWTDQHKGEKIKVVSCWNDKEEARFVTSEIEKYLNKKTYLANQIAILVRASFQTRAFEEVFISNALPYQIIGGLRFYERMEIRDLLAYIRLSINNNDNLALERIINVPKRAIGNVTLKKIKEFAADNNVSIFAAIIVMLENNEIKGKAGDNLEQFVELIVTAGNKYQVESAKEATKYLLEASGYLKSLKEGDKSEETRSRQENINEMLSAIDEFDNINEFIEHSSLVMDNDSLESDFGGTIKIMTLHAAKGLEFDLVFLPGLEEGIFPHQKSISEEGQAGLEEERRIAYVGMTRARKQLYLTYTNTRRLYAEITNSIPSRFLAEIPEEACVKISSKSKLNFLGSRHNFFIQNSSKFYKKDDDNSGKTPGKKVRHEKFGIGIVIRRTGQSLEIVFENVGIKTIKEDYVEKA